MKAHRVTIQESEWCEKCRAPMLTLSTEKKPDIYDGPCHCDDRDRIALLEAQLKEARGDLGEWQAGFAEATGTVTRNPRQDVVDFIRGARRAERNAALEEAAKVADAVADEDSYGTADVIAAAIRALSKPQGGT